jgi:hypothetical protein
VATVTITTRKTRTGPSYAVRFRLGGRTYPIQHGGSFRTKREARMRRDLIAGELAAGRNPRIVLAQLSTSPTVRPMKGVGGGVPRKPRRHWRRDP